MKVLHFKTNTVNPSNGIIVWRCKTSIFKSLGINWVLKNSFGIKIETFLEISVIYS